MTGVEYAQIFAAQGCRVCLYEQQPEILPGFYGSDLLGRALRGAGHLPLLRRGVPAGCAAAEGHFYGHRQRTADAIDGAALKKIGVEAGPGGIRIDSEGRTSRPGVFAAGDCSDSMPQPMKPPRQPGGPLR